MPIPAVTRLIVDCWVKAEEKMLVLIEKKYWDGNEEFITELFHGELRESLEEVSKKKEFENAFLSDIKAQFEKWGYGINFSEIKKFADGIEARNIRHTRYIEGKTGGDFGLLVTRPSVTYEPSISNFNTFNSNIKKIQIDAEYRCGLLCQAKLKNQRNKWGTLTTKQKKVLPERIDYLSLVLYEYLDEDRRNLDSFHWQLCKEAKKIENIQDWLKLGNFPNKVISAEIIKDLCNGKIGTDNSEFIDNYISPEVKKSFEIKIGWPPGQQPPPFPPPPKSKLVQQSTVQAQKKAQTIFIR